MRPRLLIVTPALADVNNGNWQTAYRWSRFLARDFSVRIARDWDGAPADAMIALHARRSAKPIAAFAAAGGPVALVLTGTDVYRDIDFDASAQRSLELARALVVLQPQAIEVLPARLRDRASVIYQSARTLRPAAPRRRTFDLALVGHLRAEKDPMTAIRALALLREPGSPPLRLLHAGRVPDDALGAAVRSAAAADPRIVLRGPMPHAAARQLIRRSRLLLLPSLMEGGANVAIEAITCGVPVLASRIGGSVGLLGEGYGGFFPVGDEEALATLIVRCQESPSFLDTLRLQCAQRAPLFDPGLERESVRRLAHNLLLTSRDHRT
jgi:putative glycosyltransferase (TIGR04348 family)